MLTNKDYNLNYGNYIIEYGNIGNNTAYSMYGDNPPLNPTAKKFIQPIFTSSDSGFTSAECSKNDFTIYADSVYQNRGVGYAFDNDIEPNGVDTYGGTNAWHSNRGHPHYIGFRYNKQLKVNKLICYIGPVNCMPKVWTLQYKVNGNYVDVVSGTNENPEAWQPWTINVEGNYVSDDWRLYITKSQGIDSSYTALIEIKIDADIVE